MDCPPLPTCRIDKNLSRRMVRECLPPGIWGSSWSCSELRNCGNAWRIFHAHKFKLLTKQWAMRSKSWWVVSNNISGEWDYSLRSKRVACVQRDQMYYSFNVLYLVPYHIIANISSAEAHPQHQYTTLPLTFKRNTNKLWGFTLFLIETLAVRHRSGFLSHMSP